MNVRGMETSFSILVFSLERDSWRKSENPAPIWLIVAGFVIGGKERTGDPIYDAELYAIYLDPGHMRHGTGTLLTRALARALQSQGFHSLLVWVLAANPARYFYAALGAQYVREATITIGGAELSEYAYGWPTLATLIA